MDVTAAATPGWGRDRGTEGRTAQPSSLSAFVLAPRPLEEMRGRQNFPGTSTGMEYAGPASGPHRHPGHLRAWLAPLLDSRQSPAFHPAAESAIALDFLIVIGLSEITECADFFFVFTFLKCSLLTYRLQLFSWSTSWLMKATAVLGGVNLFSAWNRPYLSPAHNTLRSRFKHTQ